MIIHLNTPDFATRVLFVIPSCTAHVAATTPGAALAGQSLTVGRIAW